MIHAICSKQGCGVIQATYHVDDGRIVPFGPITTADPSPWVDGRLVVDCECGNRQSYRPETVERMARGAIAAGSAAFLV